MECVCSPVGAETTELFPNEVLGNQLGEFLDEDRESPEHKNNGPDGKPKDSNSNSNNNNGDDVNDVGLRQRKTRNTNSKDESSPVASPKKEWNGKDEEDETPKSPSAKKTSRSFE